MTNMNIKKSICIYFLILSFSAISLLCRGQEANPYFSNSRIPVPRKKKLAAYSKRVVVANQLFRISLTLEEPRKDVAPVPVPARIGVDSIFSQFKFSILS